MISLSFFLYVFDNSDSFFQSITETLRATSLKTSRENASVFNPEMIAFLGDPSTLNLGLIESSVP